MKSLKCILPLQPRRKSLGKHMGQECHHECQRPRPRQKQRHPANRRQRVQHKRNHRHQQRQQRSPPSSRQRREWRGRQNQPLRRSCTAQLDSKWPFYLFQCLMPWNFGWEIAYYYIDILLTILLRYTVQHGLLQKSRGSPRRIARKLVSMRENSYLALIHSKFKSWTCMNLHDLTWTPELLCPYSAQVCLGESWRCQLKDWQFTHVQTSRRGREKKKVWLRWALWCYDHLMSFKTHFKNGKDPLRSGLDSLWTLSADFKAVAGATFFLYLNQLHFQTSRPLDLLVSASSRYLWCNSMKS